ncbi:fimbria/pilus outer membrane usher protein [Enterobacter cloacae]|nr:fimbria/pilus outer membrane usher protein [Enterobacter cloacae]
MMFSLKYPSIKMRGLFIFAALALHIKCVYAVEFNMDLLGDEKDNIDLSRFSEAGYIMPGTYLLKVRINEFTLSEKEVLFFEYDENSKTVAPCLDTDIIDMLGLKPEAKEKIIWWHNQQCADFSQLPGMSAKGNLSESALIISIPQAWLEYQDANWLPPTHWEEGTDGYLFDYNVNVGLTRNVNTDTTKDASGTGVTGINVGAWRVRADWQSSYQHKAQYTKKSFDWSRFYAYRALKKIGAKITAGESYLDSDIFDSWRYTGASIVSDDRMLPPNLRGYAPSISGIARTNATVTISQQGRVIYETTVATGPFLIEDLKSAVNGKLDVKVSEQDGTEQNFQVDTASIPYLTRPGQLRYKLALGKPSDFDHKFEGDVFGTGEFSWGINNAYSLYGGNIFSENYNALAVGIGRDLLSFGAVSADVTQSIATIDGERKQGKSWRLSYSKRFDELNSEVSFAGYRFSERDFLSMGEYLGARYHNAQSGNNKELYTITANKSFPDYRITTYLSWSHQTYWDHKVSDRYSFSTSRYFDIGKIRNLSASVNATQNTYMGRKDRYAYINISIPMQSGSVNYNSGYGNGRNTHAVGWHQRVNDNSSYMLRAGYENNANASATKNVSGFYSYNGNVSDANLNATWQESSYSAAGLSLSGGLTATKHGIALHRGSNGGTRIMVDTDGISDVPFSSSARTNKGGLAVIPDVSSYYKVAASIDVNELPADVEHRSAPVKEFVLTEGAIGYRKFDLIEGKKRMAAIRNSHGEHPPFGATVHDEANRELGIVGDDGMVWLTGLKEGQSLTVKWAGKEQCTVVLPQELDAETLLLPCNNSES